MPVLQNSQIDLISISKKISYHLRHKPKEIDLILDPEGWTDLNIFFAKFCQKYDQKLDTNILDQIIESSDKTRFEIRDDQIRAKYGHTVEDLTIKYPILEHSLSLYHGTSIQLLPKIKLEGLKKMNRLFIHLTSDIDLAKKTALRKSKEIFIIEIKTEELMKTQSIFVADNQIFLTGEILPDFLLFE